MSTTTADPSASEVPARLVATRGQVAAAFDEWQRRLEEDPDQFAGDPGSTYGEECADYLIALVMGTAS
jgi:hypothetical protein